MVLPVPVASRLPGGHQVPRPGAMALQQPTSSSHTPITETPPGNMPCVSCLHHDSARFTAHSAAFLMLVSALMGQGSGKLLFLSPCWPASRRKVSQSHPEPLGMCVPQDLWFRQQE